MGRHHLVLYEPTESRVSTRFNGLLYSLPARKLGKRRLSSARVVAGGQTPRRIPTYDFVPCEHVVQRRTQGTDRELRKMVEYNH